MENRPGCGHPHGWGEVLVVPVPPSLGAPFTSLWKGPGSVDWGGWLRHRVPGVLPNHADTAHSVQFFDTYSVVTTTRDTAHENKNLGDWVRVTPCVRDVSEVSEKCVVRLFWFLVAGFGVRQEESADAGAQSLQL